MIGSIQSLHFSFATEVVFPKSLKSRHWDVRVCKGNPAKDPSGVQVGQLLLTNTNLLQNLIRKGVWGGLCGTFLTPRWPKEDTFLHASKLALTTTNLDPSRSKRFKVNTHLPFCEIHLVVLLSSGQLLHFNDPGYRIQAKLATTQSEMRRKAWVEARECVGENKKTLSAGPRC